MIKIKKLGERYGSELENHLDEERYNWGLWFAVATLCGTLTYFALPYEPAYPQEGGLIVLLGVALASYGLWGARVGEVTLLFISLLVTAFGLGFGAASMSVQHHEATPILTEQLSFQNLTGRVRIIEPTKNGVRLTLYDVKDLQDRSLPPLRMVVRGKSITDYPQDSLIKGRGSFYPPRPPTWNEDFDGVRHGWFRSIGGYGYSLGAPIVLERAEEKAYFVSRLRLAIDDHIRRLLPHQSGLVASALLTGYRTSLPQPLWEAMRGSGLAHLLAISGLHMALISGAIFFIVRLFLAAIPSLALNYNIKKGAALCAIAGGFFYLLLTGGTTPTMRAFIMVCLFFLAVMMSRRIYALAMVAWAAVALILLQPERVVSSGFQMSFIAVIALVAFFGHYYRKRRDWQDEQQRWQSIMLIRYMGAVMLSSLIAGSVTMPFVAYHFHILPLYGLFANMLAVPLTAFWIMPMGLLSLVMMPFGWDYPFLWLMGEAIEILIAIADEVYGWRGSTMGVGVFPSYLLLLWSFGIFWLCFWKRRRSWGIPLMLLSVVLMSSSPLPLLMVAQDGSSALFTKTEQGERIMIPMVAGEDDWNLERWQVSFAATSVPLERWLEDSDDMTCDRDACLWLKDSITIAFVYGEAALAEECVQSDVVVSSLAWSASQSCLASLIDKETRIEKGSHSLWRDGSSWQWQEMRIRDGARLWHRSLFSSFKDFSIK